MILGFKFGLLKDYPLKSSIELVIKLHFYVPIQGRKKVSAIFVIMR